MRHLFISILLLFFLFKNKIKAQENQHLNQTSFAKYLHFDSLVNYGLLWNNENKRWILPQNKKKENIELWGHLLPKLIKDGVVITPKELSYLAETSNTEMVLTGTANRSPEHWNKFPPLVQNIYFKKPLKAFLIIDTIAKVVTIDTLHAKRFYTYYPHGRINPIDSQSIPIVYEFKEILVKNANMIVFISDYASKNIDAENMMIKTTSSYFKNDEYTTKLLTTKIDWDNNKEFDIIFFNEKVIENATSDGDETNNYEASFIAMIYDGIWYRTAFSENGQDGVEGF